MKYVLLALALSACGPYEFEQGFDDETCLAIDADLPTEVQEAALEAIEAWEPHPVDVDVSIGGNCKNRVSMEDHENFPDAYATAPKTLTWDGRRGESDIIVNPEWWTKHITRMRRGDRTAEYHCQMVGALIHEMGHWWGLQDHSDDHRDVMRTTMKLEDCFDTVTPEARARVEALY